MGPIATLLAQRISLGLLLLFLVSILIFVGTMLLPGDVAQQILGQAESTCGLAPASRDASVLAVLAGQTDVWD